MLNAALQQPTDMNLTRQLSQDINLRKLCESKHCPEQRYRKKSAGINTEAKAAMIRSALLAKGVTPEVACTSLVPEKHRGPDVAMMDLDYLCCVIDTLKDSNIRCGVLLLW